MPFDPFATERDLAELIANWPAARLIATFNSLPGVAPVKSFSPIDLRLGTDDERGGRQRTGLCT
jgi:hypothetical protein